MPHKLIPILGLMLLLVHCSLKTDDSTPEASGKEIWEQRIATLKPGMSRDLVETILPPYTEDGCIRDRVIAYSEQCLMYHLDPSWKVAIRYDYTGISRNEAGRLTGVDSPRNRLLDIPVLYHVDRPFWLEPTPTVTHSPADQADDDNLKHEFVNTLWQKARETAGSAKNVAPPDKTFLELQSMGYLSGYENAPQQMNVTVHESDLAFPGYNLYVSGHSSKAFLTDMEGNLLHVWEYRGSRKFTCFRRAHLLDNGDLLAVVEKITLIKMDKDSRVLWSRYRNYHHDLCFDENGLIYAICQQTEFVPGFFEQSPVINDYIHVLDSNGQILRQISLLDAFLRSSFAPILHQAVSIVDPLHTNTIQLFDGSQAHRSELFKRGNFLLSFRSLDTIAILDPDQEKIVWALTGQWKGQHEPVLLDSGNILLFDNLGQPGLSKVIEFDPFTQHISWSYEGTPENGFYSAECGACYRLPNGNTLIVESFAGRAFELTEDKHLVWEFYNPARAGDNNELIGTLFDLVRIEKDRTKQWLSVPADK